MASTKWFYVISVGLKVHMGMLKFARMVVWGILIFTGSNSSAEATTYIVMEGHKEVGRWIEDDGKDDVEVIQNAKPENLRFEKVGGDSAKPEKVTRERVDKNPSKTQSDELFRPRYEWFYEADGLRRAKNMVSEKNLPMALYFHATWCPYCKQFERNILGNRDVQDFLRHYIRVEIDSDKNKAAAREYGVKSYPTFFVVDSKGVRTKINHSVSAKQFIQLCARAGLIQR